MPKFLGDSYCCGVCEKCVTVCPGLAITLVDFREDRESPIVSIPYEFQYGNLQKSDSVTVMDTSGNDLGQVEVREVLAIEGNDRTVIVRVKAPARICKTDRRYSGSGIDSIPSNGPLCSTY